MQQKKTFDFMGVKVECILTDKEPEDYSPGADGGVYGAPVLDDPTTFRVWFKGLVKDYVIVHECWHLYFAIMKHIDSRVHTLDELYEEIYAYTFHTLYSRVLETVTTMKLYKKFWELHKEEEKKDDGK